jgi:hypothetical protein
VTPGVSPSLCFNDEMAGKNPLVKPLNKLKDTALGAISDPKGTADKVVEQAKGAASLGKMVAEGVAGEVVSRARGRKPSDAPRAESAPAQPATAPPTKKQGDPVAPTVRSAAPSPAAPSPAAPSPAEPPVDRADKRAAQKVTPADVAKKTAKKAPAKKTPAKKAPAQKAATKKAAAKKAPVKKAAAKTPAKKAAQGSPGDKLPPRKRTASAAEVAEGGPGVETPVGTTGAAPGSNPDTAESDLQQPGTEGIVEPGTAKEIAKEAERGRRGAQGNAG